MAQPRDLHTVPLGNLDQGLAGIGHHVAAVQREAHTGARRRAQTCTSWGKYFSTLSKAFGAAWPSPQMEASRMT